jgi:S1-C subfamily serine protease
MSRPFAFVMLALTAMMAFMVGLVVAGSVAVTSDPTRGSRPSDPAPAAIHASPVVRASQATPRQATGLVNFADIAERINPAVVNIEASTRASESTNRRRRPQPDSGPFDEGARGSQSTPLLRPQSGSGFVIDKNGQILTNHGKVFRRPQPGGTGARYRSRYRHRAH